MATIIPLTDAAAPELADYMQLTDIALRKKLETERGLYIAESSKVIERAIASGHEPHSVMIQEQWIETTLPLLKEFPDCPVYVVSSAVAREVAGFDIHRGALASMNRPALPTLEFILKDARRVVILEDLVDHTNVGAIFRAAAGFGVDAVLVSPRCADPLYRRSVRVSMGTVFQVPWTRIPHWEEAKTILAAEGFHVAALALADEATSLRVFAKAAPKNVALVLGAEGDGLSRGALAVADSIVTIPMMNGVDSLNVASACAVALYAIT